MFHDCRKMYQEKKLIWIHCRTLNFLVLFQRLAESTLLLSPFNDENKIHEENASQSYLKAFSSLISLQNLSEGRLDKYILLILGLGGKNLDEMCNECLNLKVMLLQNNMVTQNAKHERKEGISIEILKTHYGNKLPSHCATDRMPPMLCKSFSVVQTSVKTIWLS